MGDYCTNVPFLSNADVAPLSKKTSPIFKSAAKWILQGLMWLVFVVWTSLMFFYPLGFMNKWLLRFMNATSGTLFGLTGSLLLAFTAPVLIIALLSVLYLIISSEDELQDKHIG